MQQHPVVVGLVPKSRDSSFFRAVVKGGEEAASELTGVHLIFTGPDSPTVAGQVEALNTLMGQHVDAIAISANDRTALVPTLQRAMQSGIKVITYDADVSAEGRLLHLSAFSDPIIGSTCMQLVAAAAPGGRGKYAIVSTNSTAANQNTWIAAMKQASPKFPGLELVSVVYGDDLPDKSYRETQALLKSYPDLVVVASPSAVGILAAAKAVEDAGLTGKVHVTGLGLPSELEPYVRSGTIKSFAMWNPVDLGYAAVQIAVRMARGEATMPVTSISIGRLGTVSFNESGVGLLNNLSTFDESNVARFAKLF
ncbi:MAG TPA: rhamnose ABC transporter substrate-binding protein [Steroidobacteraceae bacterium]